MNQKDALMLCREALNEIPRTALTGILRERFSDTYELASALDAKFGAIDRERLEEVCMLPNTRNAPFFKKNSDGEWVEPGGKIANPGVADALDRLQEIRRSRQKEAFADHLPGQDPGDGQEDGGESPAGG